MANNFTEALDGIRAEESLKNSTKIFLRGKLLPRGKNRSRRLGYFAAAFASLIAVLAVYFAPAAYVDVDVNPSVEIVLNSFDRVIGTYAYNNEGTEILEDADIKHKNYSDAVGILIDAMVENGFAGNNSLFSVTLQSNGGENENTLLSNIESTVLKHCGSARIEAFAVGVKLRETAHELNLSPAKYLAIQDLINVDPTVTVDGCRNHSIGELKRMTMEHSGNHRMMNGRMGGRMGGHHQN